jgi:hypothetical protein
MSAAEHAPAWVALGGLHGSELAAIGVVEGHVAVPPLDELELDPPLLDDDEPPDDELEEEDDDPLPLDPLLVDPPLLEPPLEEEEPPDELPFLPLPGCVPASPSMTGSSMIVWVQAMRAAARPTSPSFFSMAPRAWRSRRVAENPRACVFRCFD